MYKSVYLPEPSPRTAKRSSRFAKLRNAVLLIVLFGISCGYFVWKRASWHQPAVVHARGKIVWHKCPEGYARVFDCGTLIAPLDYTNLDDSRDATIEMVRYKAAAGKTPRDEVLGSLLFNPGGPGASGIELVAHEEGTPIEYQTVNLFDKLMGSKYDIVSFDPRGVGDTWPQVVCFSDDDELLYYDLTKSALGLPGSHSRKTMKHEVGSLLAELQVFGGMCSNAKDKELLQYLGTTFVARDMHLMHQALGDPKIHYWGMSYGSVLGSTYADMFPESVGRLLIDGVLDVPTYYDGTWRHSFRDTEAELDHFFKECFESGADNCRLASLASSYEELKKLVLDYGDRLKTHPIPVPNADPPRVLNYLEFMSNTLTPMYVPFLWPQLAERFYEAIAEGKPESLLLPVDLHPHRNRKYEAFEAILCGDAHSPPAPDNITAMWSISDFERHAAPMAEDSPHFSCVFSHLAPLCEGAWQYRSAETHHGNFTSETSFPLLAIGNEFDPVTPGRYADKMASLFPNAVSIRRDGYGHCSQSLPSQCVDNVIRKYFVDGELPEPGTRCPVDISIFGPWQMSSNHAVFSEALVRALL